MQQRQVSVPPARGRLVRGECPRLAPARRWPALLLGIALALQAGPAFAGLLLKPKGQGAQPLRAKALDAQVSIEGQFASTRLLMTFANESGERQEADFLYTAPEGAVVTSFAYWYGEEKVVARVVEKERAAEIYRRITSRMRDPALIEMTGRNTFRVRIFPILPNADLKIEMRFAQTLPADAAGPFYELALRDFAGDGGTLESVKADVRVKPGAGIRRVENSLGLPVTRENGGYRLSLAAKNYRPQKDLRVALLREPQALHASLVSARSGGSEGFFALALTPRQALTAPRVRLTGISTREVAPAKLPDVAAGQALPLFGRYRGSGEAALTLSGTAGGKPVTYQTKVRFSGERDPENPAVKLWAAERIEQLSASARNRAAVVRLSLRYTLPSKFTSWLAVPRVEMQRYRQEAEQERIRRRMEAAADGLARHILNHTEGSREARRLRADLGRWAAAVHENPRWIVSARLSSRLDDLARRYTEEQYSAHPNRARMATLRREMARLSRAAGESASQRLHWAEYSHLIGLSERLRDRLLAERRKEKPDAALLRDLERRFIAIGTRMQNAEYAKARAERLAVRADLEKVNRRIELAQADANAADPLPALGQRKAELEKREETLRARMGDPLIQVDAPEDALQVVALLPGGEVKRLAYNPAARRWEARFDIPLQAAEGEYAITLIVVLKDGTRRLTTMRYQVDLTPPAGVGRVSIPQAGERVLRLQVDGDEDTARVMALLPWGARVDLRPSGREPHRFFTLAPVPARSETGGGKVVYVLTDKAHNRTMLTVDLSAEGKR